MTASSVCRLPTRVSLQITCQKVCSSRNWTGRYLANLYSFCSTKVEFLCDLTRFLKISRGFIVSCLEGACDKLGFVLPILPVRLFPNAVQKIPEISEHPILLLSMVIKFLLRLVYTPQMRIITPRNVHYVVTTTAEWSARLLVVVTRIMSFLMLFYTFHWNWACQDTMRSHKTWPATRLALSPRIRTRTTRLLL